MKWIHANSLCSRSISDKTEAPNAIEIRMNAATAQIINNIMAVNSRLEEFLASRAESVVDMQIAAQKRGADEQQKASLEQCLSSCQAAADSITQITELAFRNKNVFDEQKRQCRNYTG
jgi:hypothetical protein